MSLSPWRCKQRTSPEWPSSVSAAQVVLVRMFHTLMVLSEEPLTMRLSSNWTQDTPGGGGEREEEKIKSSGSDLVKSNRNPTCNA